MSSELNRKGESSWNRIVSARFRIQKASWTLHANDGILVDERRRWKRLATISITLQSKRLAGWLAGYGCGTLTATEVSHEEKRSGKFGVWMMVERIVWTGLEIVALHRLFMDRLSFFIAYESFHVL